MASVESKNGDGVENTVYEVVAPSVSFDEHMQRFKNKNEPYVVNPCDPNTNVEDWLVALKQLKKILKRP